MKKLEKILNVLAWIVGIISALAIYSFLENTVNSLGILTYIDYGEEVCQGVGSGQTSWVDCDTGSSTDISLGIIVLSITLATALGNMIKNRSLMPFSNSEEGKIAFFIILISVLLWISVGIIVLLLAGQEIGVWINFILLCGVGYYAYQFNEQQQKILKDKKRETIRS